MHVGGIFCGLAKAFDYINHGILFTKLHSNGIQGIAAEWFRFYLTDRKQKVEIKSPPPPKKKSQAGNTKTWSFQRVNSRALACHNIHK
jgi:hypothetical protein